VLTLPLRRDVPRCLLVLLREIGAEAVARSPSTVFLVYALSAYLLASVQDGMRIWSAPRDVAE
jgi:hypothetical protein